MVNLDKLPPGWEPASTDVLERTVELALRALQTSGPTPVQERFAAYYAVLGNYAGASFLDVAPNEASAFTAADLFAVSLLSVEVGPQAARRILGETEPAATLRRRLAEYHLPSNATLQTANEQTLLAMAGLHLDVKKVLAPVKAARSNAWVTASKLCARKRPQLFPVRDRVICKYLGLGSNYEVDWQAFRHLLRQPEVTSAIQAAVNATDLDESNVVLDSIPLRLLDVALWTYAIGQDDPT